MRDPLARRAINQLAIHDVPVAVRLWNGEEYRPSVASRVNVSIHSRRALRALAAPTLGSLARAYVEQQIDLEGDIRDILSVGERLAGAMTDSDRKIPPVLAWVRQTRPATRRNISHHYDISNDFYALWLDRRLVYSCAYFKREHDTLEQAQEQKLDLICRKLMLRSGERLLDIGCGWGGLIFWAAERYGALCHGITLSRHQFEHVREQIAARGLAGRVSAELVDYRELSGAERFDKIASVGMFEHVGSANLRRYFGRITALLKPGGLALNHGITAGTVGATGVRSGVSDFIEDYVFPGGELVHVARVLECASREGLECVDVESLRPHYARTLWHWVERLEANAEAARRIAGEQRFRVWRIYMAGSAHAFTRGWISLYQAVAGKPLPDGSLPYPYTRDHVYAALT